MHSNTDICTNFKEQKDIVDSHQGEVYVLPTSTCLYIRHGATHLCEEIVGD